MGFQALNPATEEEGVEEAEQRSIRIPVLAHAYSNPIRRKVEKVLSYKRVDVAVSSTTEKKGAIPIAL